MQPFYQGKIDTFCAIYAVLNALQILHDVRPGKARDLFNHVLVSESKNEATFWDILNHKTDYIAMVDRMLAFTQTQYPLRIEPPFSPGASKSEVWSALDTFSVPEARRTAVFRFSRHQPNCLVPITDHWTTALRMQDNVLHLFDCSLEPGGVYRLPKENVAVRLGMVNKEYFAIPPEHVRLLSLP